MKIIAGTPAPAGSFQQLTAASVQLFLTAMKRAISASLSSRAGALRSSV
jgi:hypothetical protein